ncbi:MAG: membrane protein insertase YidC [Magnetococcus sp. WYHC-3]
MDRRTFLAVALSLALLFAYQWLMTTYYPAPETRTDDTQPVAAQSAPPAKSPNMATGDGSPVPESAIPREPLREAVPPPQGSLDDAEGEPGQWLHYENDLVRVSVAQRSGRIVQVAFKKHRTSLADKSPFVFLEERDGMMFHVETGFLGAEKWVKPAGPRTLWRIEGPAQVQGDGALSLVWDNGQGLTFRKTYRFTRDSYVVDVEDRVFNRNNAQVPLHHYGQLVRTQPVVGEDAMMGSYDFQGPMGYLDGQRHQFAYDVLKEDDHTIKALSGWSGFSDKYYLGALMADAASGNKNFYFDFAAPAYRVGVVGSQLTVAAGTEHVTSLRFFLGPKELRTLEAVNPELERAIDYGWFHFLAVPLVQILHFFNDFLRNYGLAIIFLTLLIKLMFFPLASKSYRSMAEMKKLQPKVENLKKLYGDDRARLNQEMMKLYQDNKVNPLGGCLPIVVQIPVFFALYKVLYLSVEMRHAPFFFWVQDLSVMDPYYVLPLLMGASMFVQTKLNPAPADPIQAKVMLFLPVVFTFMFLTFPSGLVLYWLVNNILSIAQQTYINRKALVA